MTNDIKIPTEILLKLHAAVSEAVSTKVFAAPDASNELLRLRIAIAEVTKYINFDVKYMQTDVAQQDGKTKKEWGDRLVLKKPGMVTNFHGLFKYDEDYKTFVKRVADNKYHDDFITVVKWLTANRYIDETGKWIAAKDSFGWMLTEIFNEGYTRLVPDPEARIIMAKIDFNFSLSPEAAKKTGVQLNQEHALPTKIRTKKV